MDRCLIKKKMINNKPYLEPKLPSDQYLRQKLSTRKASKRSDKRRIKVLTDKLAREHVRLLYKKALHS
jgi:hypothetical protein